MADALGIAHLFDLTTTEKLLGFFTPLALFAVFFVAQVILPAQRVPGYVLNPETGQPRTYRLNGLLVFVVAVIIWATEVTGLPRDWFYRSSVFAVLGGTVFTIIFTLIAVFSQRSTVGQHPLLAFYQGRSPEMSFFNERFDLKMYFYVVGGSMLALNALSGAVWHHEQFPGQVNLGVYIYAAFWAFYVTDYFIWERVQLYTFDIIHEKIGFKMFWGGMVVYGWVFILPLWGLAAKPDPGFSGGWMYVWLIGVSLIYLAGWTIERGANMQKYVFKRWPERKFLGLIEPVYIAAGERKILTSGFWGAARHFNYVGAAFLGLGMALSFGYFGNPWAWVYLAFGFSMFTWRQIEDERYCEEKYGLEKWNQYRQQVRYRIFPGIY